MSRREPTRVNESPTLLWEPLFTGRFYRVVVPVVVVSWGS